MFLKLTHKSLEWVMHPVIYLGLFLLITAAFINIQYGIEDLNVMAVFSSDEPFAVQRVILNLQKNTLDPDGFYNYGYFYHTLTFYIIKLFVQFKYTIDLRFLAYTMQFIALGSYIFLLFLTYRLTHRLTHNRTISLCSAWFLGATPQLYYWAQYIHPDLLQACLVTAAAYTAFASHRFSYALLASILAGIAFGTKYSGIFILPFLFIPSLLTFLDNIRQAQRKMTSKDYIHPLLVFLAMILLFLVAWLITNPTVITNFPEFYKDLLFEKYHVSWGDRYPEPTNPLLWFPALHTEFESAGSAVIAVGLLVAFVLLIRNNQPFTNVFHTPVNRTVFTLLLYVIIGFIYTMITINVRRPKYIFHLLPFIVITGFIGIAQLHDLLKRLRWQYLLYVTLIFASVPLTAHTIRSMDWCSGKYQHQYIRATDWIENHFPPDRSILADSYSYQSPRFTNYQPIWGVKEQALQYYQPTLVIINNTMSGRWSWKKPGTSFHDRQFIIGKDDGSQEMYDFHMKLFSPSSPYKIVYEDTDIVILQDTRKQD